MSIAQMMGSKAGQAMGRALMQTAQEGRQVG